MNDDAIREAILDALHQVAPEANPAILDPTADLRDELDIDSMDQLNFMLGLNERFGVEIPERDYPRLASLDDCLAYLRERVPVA
jgi:acyl carrier protein